MFVRRAAVRYVKYTLIGRRGEKSQLSAPGVAKFKVQSLASVSQKYFPELYESGQQQIEGGVDDGAKEATRKGG